MRKIRMARLMVVVTLGLLALACAGSQVLVVRPFEGKLAPYSTLYFSTASSVFEDLSQEMTDLEEEVASQVKELGMFNNVLLGPCYENCDGVLQVNAEVTKVKKVSGTKRFMLGAFAGKASMTATIVFLEPASLDTLGSYTVTGKSGGTGVSGGTKSAVGKTARAIVQLIRDNSQ